MDGDAIIKNIEAATKKWTKQRKQEERGRARSRRQVLVRSCRYTIKDAAWKFMREAYLKASDNGSLPASARQIMYASRRQILTATGEQSLDSQYFTQTILPNYVVCHREETADWDITYDARGHFAEPHTALITPLGTLDVRGYLNKISEHKVKPLDAKAFMTGWKFPTCGPEHRFSALLFIEKEGFLPLFEAVQLAERYDIAIMSTKGMPVVACRHLADEVCGRYNIPLLVLHDFDKAGFSILATLNGDNLNQFEFSDRTNRYDYCHAFEVIDLGLRLKDVQANDLEPEPVTYRGDPTQNLTQNGATPEEIDFLCCERWYKGAEGQRVELNAFTSRAFVNWIESKLKQHGIKKVVPDAETLETAYRRALQIALVHGRLPAIFRQATAQASTMKLPRSLKKEIVKRLRADPAIPWDKAIADFAAANCKKCRGTKASEQAESPDGQDADFTKAAKKPEESRPRNGQKTATEIAAELGWSPEFVRLCQNASAIPEATMKAYFEKMQKDEDGEISTEGLLAYAKKHKRASALASTEAHLRPGEGTE